MATVAHMDITEAPSVSTIQLHTFQEDGQDSSDSEDSVYADAIRGAPQRTPPSPTNADVGDNSVTTLQPMVTVEGIGTYHSQTTPEPVPPQTDNDNARDATTDNAALMTMPQWMTDAPELPNTIRVLSPTAHL